MQNRTAYRIFLGGAALMVAACLAGFMWAGAYFRPIADDYCYDSMFITRGFVGGQVYSYFGPTVPYNGDRYSLTLAMALTQPGGALSSALLPGAAALAWLAGLALALRRGARLAGWPAGWAECLLAAGALAVFTIYQAPNRTQVFYWRSGMFTYLAPIIAQTWLAAAILGTIPARRFLGLRLAGVLILAFMAAGFSEPGTSLQGSLLGVGTLGVILAFILRKPPARRAAVLMGTAWAGTILGVIVLLSAPYNQARMAASYAHTNSLGGTLLLSLESTRTFLQRTFYQEPLPAIFGGLFFFILGLAWFAAKKPEAVISFRRAGLGLIAILVLAVGMIFVSMAPSAYAELSYPGERGLLMGRFDTVLASAAVGVLSAGAFWTLAQRWKATFLAGAVAGGLVGTWVWAAWLAAAPLSGEPQPDYPTLRVALGASNWASIGLLVIGGAVLGGGLEWLARRRRPEAGLRAVFVGLGLAWMALQFIPAGVQTASQDLLPLQKRAMLWDGRNAQIRQAAEQGQREVTVRALDSLMGIFELQENPGHWVNQCAASYYGLESLRAVQPVLTAP